MAWISFKSNHIIFKWIVSGNTLCLFEVHWVMREPKNVLETADAINMGQKQMIMIFKFEKHIKK